MNKNAIKKFAIDARNKLIASVTDKAAMLGITPDNCSEAITKGADFEVYKTAAGTEVTLNKKQCEQRRKLVDQIHARGFETVVEEVAYTWFNRICAIRFMEVNDYMYPVRVRVLSSEKEGKNEPDVVTMAPDIDWDFTDKEREEIIDAKMNNRLDDLFRMLFIKQCNLLHEVLPGLFEETEDYTEMLLNISFTNEDDVIRMLVDGIDEKDFNITTVDEDGKAAGQVHGYDFSNMLIIYWKAYKAGDIETKAKALRWLRGEYQLKRDAKEDLGINNIINDGDWFDYIKIWSEFFKKINYNGFLIMIDEMINIYRYRNSATRYNNYETMLMMYNDALQGKAKSLGIIMGGTPKALEDPVKGVFSYRNLHIAGAKYQDISFGNLFFNSDNGDVLICDNDNVSYGNSKPGGVLGTPGFMAPEIVRGEARPSRDTDRYSLAVLLFYLFMVNHPLEGKQEASIKCMDMAARVKLYGTDPIFIFDPNNKTNRPVPGIHDNANIYWPLYPEQLRQLFIKSFTVGLNNPSKRVTEPEWMNLFANMMSGLMKCTCGASVFYDESLEANGVAHTCWNCQQTVKVPTRIVIGKNTVVLNQNSKLLHHHIYSDFDMETVVGEVVQNPKNPALWGIHNEDKLNWTYEKADGTQIPVEVGKTAGIAAGVKIHFSESVGEFK